MNESQQADNKKFNKTYNNYTVSIGEALLFFLLVLIVGQIIAGIIQIPTLSMPQLSNFLLPLGFFLGFGTSAFLISLIKELSVSEVKKFFHTKTSVISIFLGSILYIVSLPIAEYLSMIVPTEGIDFLEKVYELFEQSFQMIFDYKIAAFIMVCILAPILEELIFRGLILRGMLNFGINPWGAILLSSFLFGAAHMNPWQFFGAGFIGVVLGYIYWRTQSLWLCIFLHFLNNLIAYIITMKTNSLEETVFESNYMILGGAVVLTGLIGYVFYRNTVSSAHKGTLENQEVNQNSWNDFS